MTDSNEYSLEDYDYNLPDYLIAQEPLEKRDQSRLLVMKKDGGGTQHNYFYELPQLLDDNCLLVLNDTRVFPARLMAKRLPGDGKLELLLIRNTGLPHQWEALVKPGRKAMPGVRFVCGDSLEGIIEEYTAPGRRIVSLKSTSLETEKQNITEIINRIGKVPLPPYIKKDLIDIEKYQTIHSRVEGSVAAPTAGLHFSEEVFKGLAEKGVDRCFVTLHVGPGTFLPVKDKDIRKHSMHSEYYYLSEETAHLINEASRKGKKIIPVGTTACRVLESIASDGEVRSGEGWTDIFIYPGYKFKITEGLITNFHLPKSTLLMLVSALTGRQNILEAYREAIRMEYRFYSLGDAMVIL